MVLPKLLDCLSELGVRSGDSLCVFSDISVFGIPDEARIGVREKGVGAIPALYLETFLSAVGREGSLFMPTFTYSACRDEVFDPGLTASTVGVLTEVFWKRKNVLRSSHPIFSFAGIGKQAEHLLQLDEKDCFAARSFFGKMCGVGGKYLLFGINFQNAATFVYFSLQKANVPYRFTKNFKARVSEKGKLAHYDVPYFVRHLDQENNFDPLENLAMESGVVRSARYCGGPLMLTEARAIDQFVCQELAKDPYCFVSSKP